MKNLRISFLISFVVLLVSCDPESELLLEKLTIEDDSSSPSTATSELSVEPFSDIEYCGTILSRDLINKGNFEGGTLYVSNDEERFYFMVDPKGSWMIQEIYIFAGYIENMEFSNSMNPVVSKFSYPMIYESPLQEVTIPILFQDLMIEEDWETVQIAVIAKLVYGDLEDPETKSVFAQPDLDCFFTGSRGGGYFSYNRQYCDPMTAQIMEEEEPLPGGEEEAVVYPLCIDTDELPLVTKNNDETKVEELGAVGFSADEEKMTFLFTAHEEWYISSIHVNVGELDENQFNAAGMVPVGKFDFNKSFPVPVNEYPVPFEVSFLEPDFTEAFRTGELSEKFIIQVTLVSIEVIEDIPTITETVSVYALWTDPIVASSRQRGGPAAQSDPAEPGGNGGKTPYGGYFELTMIPCE